VFPTLWCSFNLPESVWGGQPVKPCAMACCQLDLLLFSFK